MLPSIPDAPQHPCAPQHPDLPPCWAVTTDSCGDFALLSWAVAAQESEGLMLSVLKFGQQREKGDTK